MDIQTWFIIIPVILSSSLLTALLNSFLNRRKQSMELADKANQIASRLIDDLEQKIDRQRKELNDHILQLQNDQKEETDALNGHILKLQKEYREVKEENKELREKVLELEKLVELYKSENERLTKQLGKLDNRTRGLGQ